MVAAGTVPGKGGIADVNVSIPVRVLGWLQLNALDPLTAIDPFQSL